MADDKPPIAVVDLESRKRERRDERFFEIKRPEYPACNHLWRGVTLDSGTRRVYCKCGEQIDPFDALLIYAHAETRLVSTRTAIEEHQRKEAEKKARRPFLRRHVGFSARYNRPGGDITGYDMRLECGHSAVWRRHGRRTHPPKAMTCADCIREKKLADEGVASISSREAGVKAL